MSYSKWKASTTIAAPSSRLIINAEIQRVSTRSFERGRLLVKIRLTLCGTDVPAGMPARQLRRRLSQGMSAAPSKDQRRPNDILGKPDPEIGSVRYVSCGSATL
jgi:hypothetical protein